jgi:hypothetical protein
MDDKDKIIYELRRDNADLCYEIRFLNNKLLEEREKSLLRHAWEALPFPLNLVVWIGVGFILVYGF